MARPLRIEFPGALYHVTSRGNEQRPIFRSDLDRERFLFFLGQVATRFGWSVTAWVLMSNHFHFVIQTSEANLSRGMHWLNGSYAGWFNHVHQRSGHLFQGRFHAFLIEREAYFAEVLRYVVLNPVRAKIVGHPADYQWSSYRVTAGLEVAPDWFDVSSVLRFFGADAETAQTEYRSFVAAKLESVDRLWDKATNAIYLGTECWTKQMRKIVDSKPRSTDHPTTQRSVGRPKMSAIVKTVSWLVKVPYETVRSLRGDPWRWLIAWLGWNEGLVTLRSIAAALRLRSEGYVSKLIRRCEQELSVNQELLAQLDAAMILLRA